MNQIIELLKRWWFGPKPKMGYPQDFAIVDFTKIALRLGVKDDSNKIIYRYSLNRFGNYYLRKYRYSEERVHLLKEIHKVPIFDKTKKDIRFPVYSRILPGEIIFTQSR
jgi:hypothetical protein